MFTRSGLSVSSRFGDLSKCGFFEVAEQVSVTVICCEWCLITELMLELRALSSAAEELCLASGHTNHTNTFEGEHFLVSVERKQRETFLSSSYNYDV